MKCIKNQETSEISRVKDKLAHEKVENENWVYIPKSEWKSLNRKPKKSEEPKKEKTTKRGRKSKNNESV